MKHLKICLGLFVALNGLLSCSSDNESNTHEIDLEYAEMIDVSYGGNAMQIYDIFLPKGRTLETKVIILVHGGGWNAGDKADMNGFKDYLKTQFPDIALVNTNYRLADDDHPLYPMQIEDITAVVRNLENRQREYRISMELGFIGISAGAHLSLLWSYAFDTDYLVNMVCSIVGPTNLLDDNYLESSDARLKALLDHFGYDQSLLKEISPLYQVKSTSPPTVLFYGGQDPLIPNSQGIDLKTRLQELEVPHQFILYANRSHGWVGPDLLDTSMKLKAFIELHL